MGDSGRWNGPRIILVVAPMIVLSGLVVLVLTLGRGRVVPASLRTSGLPRPRVPSGRPERLIVKVKESSATVSGNSLAKVGGGRFVRKMRLPGRYIISTAGTDTEKAIGRLKRQTGVVSVERDRYVRSFMTPNDANYRYQWNFPQVSAPTAWDFARGSGVTVAIVDTGVAYENFSDGLGQYHRVPDLDGTRFTSGYDFFNGDAHPNDDNGHGTHVAGTVAQTTNNSISEAGLAFNATIMPVKVLSAEGWGYASDVADGIIFAADRGARVINLSLGSDSPSSVIEEAVNYARNARRVMVVAAAGNSGSGRLGYPAAYDAVISVGATRYDRARTYYSQYGTGLDIMAPGGDVSLDQNGDGYGDGILQQTIGLSYGAGDPTVHYDYLLEGTSMATPHVAGIAAMVLSTGVDAATAESALKRGATDLGPAGYDTNYGYGLVNAAKSLQLVSEGPRAYLSAPTHSSDSRKDAKVFVRWRATDSQDDAISSYQVLYMDRNSATSTWKQWGRFNGSVTSGLFPGRPGHTYYFRVRAQDDKGNWGLWSSIDKSIVPLDNQYLTSKRGFSGAFFSASSDYYLGTITYSRREGEWASITATTKRLSLIGTGGNRSRAKIYVDGRYVKTIDPADKPGYRKTLFTAGWSGSGRHTLTVINLATPGRLQFDIDAFGIQRK